MMGKRNLTIAVVAFILLGNISFGVYNTKTGRFMQQDPIGVNPAGGKQNPFAIQKQYKDGLNIYQYTNGRPVNAVDPYGLSFLQYGNWCGKDWCGGQKPSDNSGAMGTALPIDAMDAACKQHDIAWENAKSKYDKCIENAETLGWRFCKARRQAIEKCKKDYDCDKKKANKVFVDTMHSINVNPNDWDPPAPNAEKAKRFYANVLKHFDNPEMLPDSSCP